MLISERMQGLNPYVPGEQPKDRPYIKLNANENPYPPSKKVIKAVNKFIKKNPEKLGLYPDPDSIELHAEIADMLNKTGGCLCRAKVSGSKVEPAEEDKIPFTVTKDMIYTGNGSDEVLSFVFYAFFSSNKKFVMPEHTYSFYPVYAGFYNIPMDRIPLKKDWSLDTEAMLSHASENAGGIIFANPNAPTGLGLTRAQVREMLQKASKDEIFIVDEAYCDFGGQSCIPLLAEFSNLLIVRTFSKSLCGAGMRLGFIISNPDLINTVTTVKNSVNHFPLDAVAQIAGKEACRDIGYYCDCAKRVADARDDFYDFLIKKGFYAIPSQTNFIFAKKEGLAGENIYKKIKAEGILIRHFKTPGIEDFVRITIGTPEQMAKLKDAFNKL